MSNSPLTSLRRPEQAVSAGLVYVPDQDIGPMRHAGAGSVVSIPGRSPPWIVVDHEPASVIVARWPGRLWRVKILEAAAECEQPYRYARYTRCISVAVEAEEDAAILFGPHGDDVLRILDAASRLDRSDADALARSRHSDASAAHDRAWRAWLRQKSIRDVWDETCDGTERVGGQGGGSPINNGLSVLYRMVNDRAKAVDGDTAIRAEEDEEGGRLVDPWHSAVRVLADAALALGAPGLMDDHDRACLLSGAVAVLKCS